MNVKTLQDILDFKPDFEFNGVVMTDWFELHFIGPAGNKQFTIKSGLRNSDGVTKSPYFYEETTIGKNSEQRAVAKFNKFLKQKFN